MVRSFKHALSLVLLLMVASLALVSPSQAVGSNCSSEVGFEAVSVGCTLTAIEVKKLVRSGDGATYTVASMCAHNNQKDNCLALQSCELSGGKQGTWYAVHRSRDGRTEGVGQVCLSPRDEEALGQVTPGMVLRAFERLEWPKAELVIQPPKGKTLVNFETLFYTDTPPPKRQVVRLLGQRIVIEANPTSYLWHSTQGGETWSTTDPSRRKEPQDEATDMNFFIYEKTGDYTPSVDVTYSGRFRVGNGPWRDIPGTLTVTGASQPLKVVEAVPVLVDPNGG